MAGAGLGDGSGQEGTARRRHNLSRRPPVTASDSGLGQVQRHGAHRRAGDVVWFEPGEKHWHGASPTTAMQHIAIQEALDGKAVDWLEQVSEAQYQTKSSRNS